MKLRLKRSSFVQYLCRVFPHVVVSLEEKDEKRTTGYINIPRTGAINVNVYSIPHTPEIEILDT